MFVNIFSNYDCGNFWASPKNYFYNYKKSQSYEIDNLKSKITSKSLIFSGGSINKILLSQINDIKNENIKIDFISWGLGINIFDYTKQNTLIGNISKSKKIFVNYLINFTLKGFYLINKSRHFFIFVLLLPSLESSIILFNITSSTVSSF